METGTIVQSSDKSYSDLELVVSTRIGRNVNPVFTTDVPEDVLWNTYLEALPAEVRQHYNCHACRDFIKRYGGLVTIDEVGRQYPLLWENPDDQIGAPFDKVVHNLKGLVGNAKVTGIFQWSLRIWGTPRTTSKKGDWGHLWGGANFSHKPEEIAKNTGEALQHFASVSVALQEYPLDVANQALRVLDADALTRSEKARGVALWFAHLHVALMGVTGRQRRNMIWLAVATAPVGYCHIRSTIISTLLDDIKAGKPFNVIRDRWAKKLNPVNYQRPKAPPKEGTIVRAEKLVLENGYDRSLQRRFARLDEVDALMHSAPPTTLYWFPKDQPEAERKGGLFDHLRTPPQATKEIELPPEVMTWNTFRDRILHGAMSIEMQVPASGTFYGLTTAVDPEAPPILQWDAIEGLPRNPFAWYVYVPGGSPSGQWNLKWGTWVKVNAIFPNPPHWQRAEAFAHQPQFALLALEGCQDKEMTERSGSLGLFPETLRSELHEIRSVLEAYSKTRYVLGNTEGTANGFAIQKGLNLKVHLRVRSAGGMATYIIDRWE